MAYNYPTEWACAFLEKEPEVRKERAINLVKSLGFEVKLVDVNTSGTEWLPDPNDSNVLVQPLTSIKGLGEKAIEEIIKNRPFKSIEDALFNENVVYRKFNKKALDCLIRSQSMNSLKESAESKLMLDFWKSGTTERKS
jgi:DNA polymerase-3 subunit alpha